MYFGKKQLLSRQYHRLLCPIESAELDGTCKSPCVSIEMAARNATGRIVQSLGAVQFYHSTRHGGNQSQTQTWFELLLPFRGRHPLYDAHMPRWPAANTGP